MKNIILLISLSLIILASCNQTNSSQGDNVVTGIDTTKILPSWRGGANSTKYAIIKFVTEVTDDTDTNTYVSPEERIATFDNDGTLWCEKPKAPQMEFAFEQIRKMVDKNPALLNEGEDSIYRAVIENDTNYLEKPKAKHSLLKITHSGITLENFNKKAKKFLKNEKNTERQKKHTDLVYQPMIELLEYLRDNDFKIYICSGGGNDFMRVLDKGVYNVPPENIIGSFSMDTLVYFEGDSTWKIVKSTNQIFNTNGAGKPAAINLRVGRIPIFSAGNVLNRGDVAHLTYSNSNKLHNFQLLINHDDNLHEEFYVEKAFKIVNNKKVPVKTSLEFAEEQKWNVVSMKTEWLRVFPFNKTRSYSIQSSSRK